MARAAAQGHRVVLVVATRGEHGEVVEGVLAPGEPLGERRVTETYESARLLGVHRVEFLGYVDSGMMGTPTNDSPNCFWRADLDEASGRMARILDEEQADVLTVYDANGGYGHPDHIQVHRVGTRAALQAGTTRVLQSTINRDHVMRLIQEPLATLAVSDESPGLLEEARAESFGVPEAVITTTVDVRPWLVQKRAAMRAHASQISEESWFLSLPDDAFSAAFGWEWLIREGATPGSEEWVFA